VPFSRIATHEFVVPKSIPITGMLNLSLLIIQLLYGDTLLFFQAPYRFILQPPQVHDARYGH
jgi:hypothetical protein